MTTQSDKQEDNQPALEPPELLPCPFCGSKAEIVIKQDTGEYGVFCGLAACCAFYAKFATVERWNARTLVQASMDNSAAIALLDKWLSEPEQADDGSLDRLRRLIDENRLSDRKFWPELSPDSEDSRAPVRDGGVAMVAADQLVREWIADCSDHLQSGEAISLPRGALTDLTKRITETPKQERSTAAINMLRRVYDAEFSFGAWPSPEEIEAVLKAATPPLAASVQTEDACSFCEHPASDHARGQLRRTEPCERPDCCCGNYQNVVKRQNAIE